MDKGRFHFVQKTEKRLNSQNQLQDLQKTLRFDNIDVKVTHNISIVQEEEGDPKVYPSDEEEEIEFDDNMLKVFALRNHLKVTVYNSHHTSTYKKLLMADLMKIYSYTNFDSLDKIAYLDLKVVKKIWDIVEMEIVIEKKEFIVTDQNKSLSYHVETIKSKSPVIKPIETGVSVASLDDFGHLHDYSKSNQFEVTRLSKIDDILTRGNSKRRGILKKAFKYWSKLTMRIEKYEHSFNALYKSPHKERHSNKKDLHIIRIDHDNQKDENDRSKLVNRFKYLKALKVGLITMIPIFICIIIWRNRKGTK